MFSYFWVCIGCGMFDFFLRGGCCWGILCGVQYLLVVEWDEVVFSSFAYPSSHMLTYTHSPFQLFQLFCHPLVCHPFFDPSFRSSQPFPFPSSFNTSSLGRLLIRRSSFAIGRNRTFIRFYWVVIIGPIMHLGRLLSAFSFLIIQYGPTFFKCYSDYSPVSQRFFQLHREAVFGNFLYL